MKRELIGLLICPACLPEEVRLQETVREISRGDIESGGYLPGHGSALRRRRGTSLKHQSNNPPRLADTPADTLQRQTIRSCSLSYPNHQKKMAQTKN
jgi:hypothetical protein